VIIPVHQGLHWTALMVDIKQQRLVFFDSLFGKNAAAVAAVRRWVADEAQVGHSPSDTLLFGGKSNV